MFVLNVHIYHDINVTSYPLSKTTNFSVIDPLVSLFLYIPVDSSMKLINMIKAAVLLGCFICQIEGTTKCTMADSSNGTLWNSDGEDLKFKSDARERGQ